MFNVSRAVFAGRNINIRRSNGAAFFSFFFGLTAISIGSSGTSGRLPVTEANRIAALSAVFPFTVRSSTALFHFPCHSSGPQDTPGLLICALRDTSAVSILVKLSYGPFQAAGRCY